jgi:toxin ParE1/3/4
MRYSRILSPRADQDLFEIASYIAQDSPQAAAHFIGAIGRRFGILQRHPRAGCRRDELLAGLRSFPFGAYVIFYREAEDGVQVLRILRGARDIEGLSWEDPEP